MDMIAAFRFAYGSPSLNQCELILVADLHAFLHSPSPCGSWPSKEPLWLETKRKEAKKRAITVQRSEMTSGLLQHRALRRRKCGVSDSFLSKEPIFEE